MATTLVNGDVALGFSADGPSSRHRVDGRRIYADGGNNGGSFSGFESSTFVPLLAGLTPLANGGLQASVNGGDTQTYLLASQPDGQPDTAPGGYSQFQAGSAVASLGAGKAFVLLQRTTDSAGDVLLSLFNANGSQIGITTANSTAPGLQSPLDITVLVGGRIVTAWSDPALGLVARVFDQGLGAVSGEIVVAPATNGASNTQLAALDNGGFVAVWSDVNGAAPSSGTDIRARLYNADGTAMGAPFLVNTTTAGEQKFPEIVALRQGGFVAVWYDGASGIMSQQFDDTGAKLGAEFKVNTAIVADTVDSFDATLMNDGRVMVAWRAPSSELIHYRFIDPRDGQVFGTSAAQESLYGSDLDDRIAAGDGRDFVFGMGGDDALIGGQGDDGLLGGTGNDILIGGPGRDFMQGQEGDDLYEVTESDDVVSELSGQGVDTVVTYASGYALNDNIENLVLGGTTAAGVGNSMANGMFGNDANNTLVGGAGNDVMAGGKGDDTYEVTDPGDTVIEQPGEGVDQVFSYLNQTVLSDNVDNLILVGAAVVAIGNAGSNALIGNGVNNTLVGGAGADVMAGGAGNDTYEVDNVGDVVQEAVGAGTDQVFSFAEGYVLAANVETLILAGSTVTGFGGVGNDTVVGNAAGNNVGGGWGDDVLFGNGGVDAFFWTGTSAGKDIITDFDALALEKIVVSQSMFQNFAVVLNHAFQSGGDTVIAYDSNTILVLKDVARNNLTADNFVFSSSALGGEHPQAARTVSAHAGSERAPPESTMDIVDMHAPALWADVPAAHQLSQFDWVLA